MNTLNASIRNTNTKGEVNSLRASGSVPAIIYGGSEKNQKISLSTLTFPHEFAAAILVEQLYRASEIMKGTSYHRV